MANKNDKTRLTVALKSVLRMLGAVLIFGGSLAYVMAQSSSSSYQAVDFLNPEASLSSSGSYKLNDSIGSYGGVNQSTGYTECTGDFATLSPCGAKVTPPTPPTPPVEPPAIGAGGDFPDHQDCNQPNCINNNPTPPVEEPPQKPFVLPGITEPVTHPAAPVEVKPTVTPAKLVPVVTPPVQPTRPVIVITPPVVHTVAPEVATPAAGVLCEDVACSEGTLLRPSAGVKPASAGPACQLYVFGGYQFDLNCSDAALVFLAVLFSVFGLSGITFRFDRMVKVVVQRRLAKPRRLTKK